MDGLTLAVFDTDDAHRAATLRTLAEHLGEHHRWATGGEYRQLFVSLCDTAGVVCGGVLAYTHGVWLDIEFVWVAETLQQAGARHADAGRGRGGGRCPRVPAGIPGHRGFTRRRLLPGPRLSGVRGAGRLPGWAAPVLVAQGLGQRHQRPNHPLQQTPAACRLSATHSSRVRPGLLQRAVRR